MQWTKLTFPVGILHPQLGAWETNPSWFADWEACSPHRISYCHPSSLAGSPDRRTQNHEASFCPDPPIHLFVALLRPPPSMTIVQALPYKVGIPAYQWSVPRLCNSLTPLYSRQTHLGTFPAFSKAAAPFVRPGSDKHRASGRCPPTLSSPLGHLWTQSGPWSCCRE